MRRNALDEAAEQIAGRQADMRLLENLGAGAAGIGLAFDGEESVHAAVRLCRQDDAVDARQPVIGEVEAGA